MIVLISACAVFLFAADTYAQEVKEVTPAEKLIEQLDVKPEPKIRTRSITLKIPDASQGRASFNTIQFEHDSAKLTQGSTGQLLELGKALTSTRLAEESFVIEGHADAYGDRDYNKALSMRRATAVKKFLVNQIAVAEHRLQVIGKGEEEPKTDDPYDPENRRVDIVNLKVYQ